LFVFLFFGFVFSDSAGGFFPFLPRAYASFFRAPFWSEQSPLFFPPFYVVFFSCDWQELPFPFPTPGAPAESAPLFTLVTNPFPQWLHPGYQQLLFPEHFGPRLPFPLLLPDPRHIFLSGRFVNQNRSFWSGHSSFFFPTFTPPPCPCCGARLLSTIHSTKDRNIFTFLAPFFSPSRIGGTLHFLLFPKDRPTARFFSRHYPEPIRFGFSPPPFQIIGIDRLSPLSTALIGKRTPFFERGGICSPCLDLAFMPSNVSLRFQIPLQFIPVAPYHPLFFPKIPPFPVPAFRFPFWRHVGFPFFFR